MNEDEQRFRVAARRSLECCRMGDQTVGCSVEEAELGDRGDGEAACSQDLVGQGPIHRIYDWMPIHDNPAQCAGISGGFAAGWQHLPGRLRRRAPGRASSSTYAKIGPTDRARSSRSSARATLTVVHGDFRLDNMFFEVDGRQDARSPCSTGRGSASHVAPTTSATSSARACVHRRASRSHRGRRWCERYVGAALRCRRRATTAFDDCWTDYRVAVLYLFNYAVVIAGTLDLSNERGVKMARALLARAVGRDCDRRGGSALDLLE